MQHLNSNCREKDVENETKIEDSNPSLSAIYRKGSATGGAFFVSDEENGQMKDSVRSTKGSTNSPGANLNERSEPEGQGTWMYTVIPASPHTVWSPTGVSVGDLDFSKKTVI
jgi:hypothetical protein